MSNLQREIPGTMYIKDNVSPPLIPLKDVLADIDDPASPKHYKMFKDSPFLASEIEDIDVIKASLTPEEFDGYLKGNQLKYLLRHNSKNGEEDLCKAKVYMEFYEGKGIHV